MEEPVADEPFAPFSEPPSLDQHVGEQYALSSLASDPEPRLGDRPTR